MTQPDPLPPRHGFDYGSFAKRRNRAVIGGVGIVDYIDSFFGLYVIGNRSAGRKSQNFIDYLRAINTDHSVDKVGKRKYADES